MKTSLAAVFEGNSGEITLRELYVPEVREQEVLVRVMGCTLCASDVHSFEGRRLVPVPTVLGHEIAGEIIDFGASTARFDLAGHELNCGDRVTWAMVAHCGRCAMCQRGLPQKCLHAVKYGHEPFRPGRELLGGLAEHCLLVAGTSIVRLPKSLPLAVACPASCATATIVAALESAGDIRGRSVCVLGAGMLGLTACAMASSQGAEIVVCVDPIEKRRDLARLFGATHVLAPQEAVERAHAIVGGLGFDSIFELSGNSGALHAAWQLLRTGGSLVLVGSVFPGPPIPVAIEQIVRRHLTIHGIHNYAPQHLLAAVKFLEFHETDFPFADLVTTWYPLTSVREALRDASHADSVRVGVISSS